MTKADIFASKLDNDGQKFETDDGIDFDQLIDEMNADTSYYTSRGNEDGQLTEQSLSDHCDGDVIAYKFDDDSMIVLAGPAWDIYDGNGWDIELPQ